MQAMTGDAGDRPRSSAQLTSELVGVKSPPAAPPTVRLLPRPPSRLTLPPTVGSGPGTDAASAPLREEAH